ncbi:Orf6 [Canine mastadenovirus A]|uniref:Packaging protein 1 n=1 Tax=Canine mastadenovirus A TaxID=10537 RepID=A0A344X1W5_9ADEN|nr:Orf6 [Canine mastadenovirus A]
MWGGCIQFRISVPGAKIICFKGHHMSRMSIRGQGQVTGKRSCHLHPLLRCAKGLLLCRPAAGLRHLQNQQNEPSQDPHQCADPCPALHSDRNHLNKEAEAMEGQNPTCSRHESAYPIQSQVSKSKKQRNYVDGAAVDDLKNLWDRLQTLQQSLTEMPYAEGLKPLKNFTSFEELLSMGGDSLLNDLLDIQDSITQCCIRASKYLNKEGNCTSLNYYKQPFIAAVYGPTGCGKSQLLRNLMSAQLIVPTPETVFFITPQVDMIPPQEIAAWETQICEGNFLAGPENTVVPQSGSIMPRFIQMSYAQLTKDENYDVTSPNNIFANAASKGPIAIVMDECMEDLGGNRGIAKFFHAFPSKLLDRFPKCTGYSVIVVLHNMNPRRDQGGNIANLKIQAKVHMISPKVHPSQLNRFINIYTKGQPTAISLLLKDIFNYHRLNTNFDWIVYNTEPIDNCMHWMYLSPQEGLIPMYLNIQGKLYQALERIHRTLTDRQRWTRYYHSKKK